MATISSTGGSRTAPTRWPPEANAALDAPLKGPVGEGKALPVARARLKINQFDESKPVASGERAVTFTASLKAGKTRLQTWFYDQTGNELCGAYYARVYRK